VALEGRWVVSRAVRRVGRTLVALAAVGVLTFFASGYVIHIDEPFPTYKGD
jgi:hypothetical protein